MANQLREVFVLLVLCGVCIAGPVFFPEEAADVPIIPAAGGGSVVQSENADKYKLGEKALVGDEIKAAVPGGLVNSDEDDDSASDENVEKSTEPVKKLLIRTFTDLHPKVALELNNKTISIANATDFEGTKEADNNAPTTTEIPLEEEITKTVETVQLTSTAETTTEKDPERRSASSTTPATTVSSVSGSSLADTTDSTPASTATSLSSSSAETSTTSTTEKVTSTMETVKEKDLEAIEAEIEAEPVILTQGV